jgi:hypothetical protein
MFVKNIIFAIMEEDYIKLIFGLKLKQIRNERSLSLFGLSKLSGLSKSYLNEIENGKKYPKPDKIAILSEKLDIAYDQMVSLKLDKNLAPIGDLLRSKVLKEIPLEIFGIKESNLIDIVANAPAKVNAFITTIIDVAKHYDFNRESFYLASLRSFQQSNYNYLDDLEKNVVEFCKAYHINLDEPVNSIELEEILVEEYGYKINNTDLKKHKELYDLRSVFVPKTKTLLLASHIDEAQRIFIYAKEIAYNYLNYDLRLYTFPWIKFENFEQVLNNFYASYFAGALVLPRNVMVSQLTSLFQNKTFNKNTFIKNISTFTSSPETFYQRLTNLLPKDFNIQNLFFLRFSHDVGSSNFYLNKELHLPNQQSPHANETNEHYCRRWVSLKVLEDISKSKKDHVFDLQISQYPDDDDLSYLVFSSAVKDPFKDNQYRSISVGLLINKQLKKKIAFLEDNNIKKEFVGITCERCAILNCKERKSPPILLEKNNKNKIIEDVVDELTEQFS